MEDGQYDSTVMQILATCSMVPNFLAVLGDKYPAEAVPLGGKVLGLGYNLEEDEVAFKLKLIFYVKVKNR